MPSRDSFPTDWATASIKEIVDPLRAITYGIVQPGPRFDPDRGIPMIRGQDYSSGTVRADDLYHVDPRLAAKFSRASVQGGDLLISIVGYVGTVAEVPAELAGANLTQTTARVSIREDLKGRYFLHFLRSHYFKGEVKRFTKGSAQPGLNLADVEVMRVAYPQDASDRATIAKVLDTLDTTIRQTEEVIEKLKQVKQGLLHDLLTRGIDTNGELRPPQSQAPQLYKDSPLGWIPNSWEIKRGRDVCNEIIVGIVVRPTQYYRASGVTVLRSANVREEGLALENAVFMSNRDHQNQQKSAVRPGDVLTVRTGYPGTSCVVDEQVAEANCVDIIISRPNANTNPHFWAMWINSSFGKEQVLRVQGGLAQQHFNVGELAAMWVAMPSSSEQDAIVERVRAMNMRRSAEERSAALHRDMKSGLMDDLLTGRVRVTALLNAIP